eukprot:TRINITY_DN7005_c0_g1_i2.p1 TRINITY_DN7005_c0_g1~~TRINITY_DN7005_c0_g1_i2.p1  ORF type:complete len:474 (+),score=80.45 TRINITY_DN7005_c0_g1_i2:2-1423(+)
MATLWPVWVCKFLQESFATDLPAAKEASQSASASLAQHKLSHVGSDQHVVLLLGEGNFSFARALVSMIARLRRQKSGLHFDDEDDEADTLRSMSRESDLLEKFFHLSIAEILDRVHVVATSFDSHTDLLIKYPEIEPILRDLLQLQSKGHMTLLHGINAWQTDVHFPSIQFQHVVWNHPHLGLEDFRLHRFLMAHLFDSLGNSVVAKGRVSVSLVEGQPERWDIVNQAGQKCFALTDRVPFCPKDWPGYETRRNRNAQSFQNRHTKRHTRSTMHSYLLQFQLDDRPQDTTAAQVPQSIAVERIEAVAKPYGCPHCPSAFTSERGRKTHVRQVHELKQYGDDWQPQRERKYKCNACRKKFADQEALWQHQISKHSQAPHVKPQGAITDELEQLTQASTHWIPCPVCAQAIPDHWEMEQHLETLKPLIGQRASCLKCNRFFTEHRALSQHLNFCRVPLEEKAVVLGDRLRKLTYM